MTSTVSCPDCGRPAEVTSRFTLGGADGTEYLRIRCRGALALLVPADDIRTPPPDPGPTRAGPLDRLHD